METVTAFQPNKFYLNNNSGTLVYILSAVDTDGRNMGLGVIVGPILAEVGDNKVGQLGNNILSNIKIVTVEAITDDGWNTLDKIRRNRMFGKWHEIDLPRKIANRIYIALRGVADLFTRLYENMDANSLYLPMAERRHQDTTKERYNEIVTAVDEAEGTWIATPHDSYLKYQDNGVIFDNSDNMMKYLKSTGFKTELSGNPG